jgi:hypothetical protein
VLTSASNPAALLLSLLVEKPCDQMKERGKLQQACEGGTNAAVQSDTKRGGTGEWRCCGRQFEALH